MLALTKKVDYGLIALSHLALHRERVATAREIAERYRLPAALLMNIMKALAQRGIVRSSRGAKGGYELACAPEGITLDAVIVALEGPVRLVQCADDGEARFSRNAGESGDGESVLRKNPPEPDSVGMNMKNPPAEPGAMGRYGKGNCELVTICPVCGPVQRLHQRLRSFLTEVTLADIASDAEYGAPACRPCDEMVSVGLNPR